ncbi:fibronectin-binding domain-containing protein [bacterium]|jgi:predicted ribosome quality control (RQC) complex YloA/Tae2 family protein|nr:fibronectin-binding domain-containing protein [bacterium]
MSLDWIELEFLCAELNQQLVGAKVQELYQPSETQVLLTLYNAGSRFFWILQPDPELPCLYPVNAKGKMPDSPSAFCFKLRKHLEGARLSLVNPIAGDRICRFEFERGDESSTLIVDLRSQLSNLYLLDDDDRILSSLRNVSRDEKAGEGSWSVPKHPRPSLQEVSWNELEVEEAWENSDSSYFISRAREFTPRFMNWLMEQDKQGQFLEFIEEKFTQLRQNPVMELLMDELGIVDYNLFPGKPWEGKRIVKESISSLFAEYFPDFENRRLLRKVKDRVANALEKEIGSLRVKSEKLLVRKSLYETHSRVEQKASLLSSQREKMKAFSKTVTLVDYFNEDRELVMEIDPRLTVSQNVDRLYKSARKYKRGIPRIEVQLEELDKTTRALVREVEKIRHETDFKKIEERFQTLQELGVISRKQSQNKATSSKAKPKASSLRSFRSSEGIQLYAGRNDKENDYLMKRVGKKEDLWFHVEGCPGAHVLLKKASNMTRTSVREAAQLAAYYSKKRYDGKTQVIYTELKHVKKIPGQGPGKVRLERAQALTVRLDHGIINRLRRLPEDPEDEISQASSET